jgi:hypothetical protein
VVIHTTLTIEAADPHLRFRNQFEVGGAVASYHWEGLRSVETSDRQMGWSLCDGRNPFDGYAASMANAGVPISQRIPGLAEHWADAAGVVTVQGSGNVSIVLARPAAPHFENFLIAAFSGNLRVLIEIDLAFVDKDDAPLPTVEGFFDRSEPAFLHREASFSVHRPESLEGRYVEGGILRYGRLWSASKK